ncbi:hypothetical protein HII36_39595 [Nonomuraea sp. NN258]|uniref:hypothetical protein n=1 Tax=Nonomuraea antri TaxID=2730852 RepID=UPI00156A3C13|nr:hypothetical protein [Nonomuraea antri]NRQ37892.1 hypothetical protein [Nonomuraea antri]
MIKLAERLIAHVLPQTTASAGCIPQNYCSHCGGSYYKRIFIYADCSWDTTACNNPCPWF